MELDGNTIYVTIKEAQYHPVTEEIIHIDLLRVRRDVKMKFSIPLNLVGDAIGAVEGGIVSQAASSIELECFPTNVPDNIDVDITNLELNGTLTAIDIDLPEDTVLISAEDTTIAVCAPPQAEIEPEVEEDEELEEGDDDRDRVERHPKGQGLLREPSAGRGYGKLRQGKGDRGGERQTLTLHLRQGLRPDERRPSEILQGRLHRLSGQIRLCFPQHRPTRRRRPFRRARPQRRGRRHDS